MQSIGGRKGKREQKQGEESQSVTKPVRGEVGEDVKTKTAGMGFSEKERGGGGHAHISIRADTSCCANGP